MQILEAYDLTGSLRGAAALVGCDHKTVAHWVRVREQATGELPTRAARPALVMVEPFAGKVDELVARSHGQIRADKAHGVLVAMGYEGSYRTTRRVVAEAKRRWRQKHGRVTRPWIPQPGLWLQWDYGDGPEVQGVRAVLFCAWLAWSRYRVVVPLRDKTLAIGGDRAGSHAALPERGSHLRAHRQREDGDGRACVRDRGAQPDDRGGLPPLRADDRDLRAGGSAEQGRQRGRGAGGQGGSGADRSQPARGVCGLAGAGDRV